MFTDLLERKRRPHTRKGHTLGTERDRREVHFSTRFGRLAKSLGMTGVSVHTLRHSCASRMVATGVPLSFVARVTGHSTLSCAARYGKHAPTDARRIAIRALEAATAGQGGEVGSQSPATTGPRAPRPRRPSRRRRRLHPARLGRQPALLTQSGRPEPLPSRPTTPSPGGDGDPSTGYDPGARGGGGAWASPRSSGPPPTGWPRPRRRSRVHPPRLGRCSAPLRCRSGRPEPLPGCPPAVSSLLVSQRIPK